MSFKYVIVFIEKNLAVKQNYNNKKKKMFGSKNIK